MFFVASLLLAFVVQHVRGALAASQQHPTYRGDTTPYLPAPQYDNYRGGDSSSSYLGGNGGVPMRPPPPLLMHGGASGLHGGAGTSAADPPSLPGRGLEGAQTYRPFPAGQSSARASMPQFLSARGDVQFGNALGNRYERVGSVREEQEPPLAPRGAPPGVVPAGDGGRSMPALHGGGLGAESEQRGTALHVPALALRQAGPQHNTPVPEHRELRREADARHQPPMMGPRRVREEEDPLPGMHGGDEHRPPRDVIRGPGHALRLPQHNTPVPEHRELRVGPEDRGGVLAAERQSLGVREEVLPAMQDPREMIRGPGHALRLHTQASGFRLGTASPNVPHHRMDTPGNTPTQSRAATPVTGRGERTSRAATPVTGRERTATPVTGRERTSFPGRESTLARGEPRLEEAMRNLQDPFGSLGAASVGIVGGAAPQQIGGASSSSDGTRLPHAASAPHFDVVNASSSRADSRAEEPAFWRARHRGGDFSPQFREEFREELGTPPEVVAQVRESPARGLVRGEVDARGVSEEQERGGRRGGVMPLPRGDADGIGRPESGHIRADRDLRRFDVAGNLFSGLDVPAGEHDDCPISLEPCREPIMAEDG